MCVIAGVNRARKMLPLVQRYLGLGIPSERHSPRYGGTSQRGASECHSGLCAKIRSALLVVPSGMADAQSFRTGIQGQRLSIG